MAEGWWRVSDDYTYQMESGVIAHAPVRGSLLEFQIHCASARLGFPTFGGPAQPSLAASALITAISRNLEVSKSQESTRTLRGQPRRCCQATDCHFSPVWQHAAYIKVHDLSARNVRKRPKGDQGSPVCRRARRRALMLPSSCPRWCHAPPCCVQ